MKDGTYIGHYLSNKVLNFRTTYMIRIIEGKFYPLFGRGVDDRLEQFTPVITARVENGKAVNLT